MNYPKFLSGVLVRPPKKRVPRIVFGIRRIAGAYQYFTIGPRDLREEYWEHQLESFRSEAA